MSAVKCFCYSFVGYIDS